MCVCVQEVKLQAAEQERERAVCSARRLLVQSGVAENGKEEEEEEEGKGTLYM